MKGNLQRENKELRPLQKMFDEVPDRYDLMNRLLTVRFDERWRKMAARECVKGNPSKILDLCTGTGDLAIQIARLANRKTEILGLDYSPAMLSMAQKKASEKGLDQIKFIKGDAAALPFENESIDAIAIAFAFRNRFQEDSV
jgi:demethylmenaquinone methyltransferase/2-methoxy-6-polyprenyl-1,4-benzoquinol methylase